MRQVSEKRKTRWAAGLCLGLALILSAAGCGGGSTPAAALTVTLTPAAVTTLVGSFVQFSVVPSATIDSATFLVNDVAGGNTTVGTITTDGLYQAPTLVPANTTITVTVQAANSSNGTSASATATVTLDSGVRVSFAPTTFTIGNGDTFPLPVKVKVIGVPPNASISGVCDNLGLTSATPCTAVTWGANNGSIDGNGTYTGPGTDGTATITATSVYDTTRSATATITLVDPVDPTVTSISNDVGAIGATQQDIYLTGANFLSDTVVKANGTLVNNTDLVSSSVLRVRLATSDLDVPGTPTTLTFTAAQQGGTDQSCSTPCQLTLSAQRPAIVGTVPDSFKAGSTADIFVDGGYYGTSGSPTVSADFGGQLASVISANQLSIPAAGSSTPGLAPITVTSNVTGASVGSAVANVAVQPVISTALVPSASPTVGTQPSSVAINTATGIAVVANQGSNSVALIDLASPASPLGFICTSDALAGASLLPNDSSCLASGPTSVAVDNLRNLALVTNGATKTVAVIDLTAKKVTQIIVPATVNGITRTPWAVGINPLSGKAIVAYQSAGFASVIDLTQTPAVISGLVAVSTGPTPRIAVSPRLNWAVVTPGGAGSMAIVNLGRQNTNPISSASRTSNVVTIATSSAHTLRPGDPVLITGVADSSFNGVFNVSGVSGNTFTYSQTASDKTSGGGTASYALQIVTVATSLTVSGVGINDETQKAILVDPSGTTPALIFNLLDQTSMTIPGLAATGNTTGAFNPLTNVAVTVNKNNSDGAVIDPATPALVANGTLTGLNLPVDVAIDPGTNTAVVADSGACAPPSLVGCVSIFSLGAIRTPQVLQVSRQDNGVGAALPPEIMVNSTLTTAATANPQTLTVIGSGFNGTSVVKLAGVALAAPNVVSSRELTVTVPAAMLTAGPRISALQVVNGATASNATAFTVSQSVDVSSAGCTVPVSAPQSVAIDSSSRNLAIVTNPGCNNVAIIQLGGANAGTGQTVAVGKNPQGVAVYVQAALAVVANADDNTASIVDINGNTVAATVNTDPTPIGVAIDQGLGLAVVTASNANVIDTFTISSTPGTPTVLPVQSRPMAVAVNPVTHIAAVANTSSNSVSLVDLKQVATTLQVAASGLPAGIAFDPITTDYLVVASLANQLLVLDPINQSTTALRMGINPTSVAYNFNSSTLVTTNGVSQTMSVMDFLSGRIRAVFSFNPSGRFAVDIHPFSNLAVIADSADNRVILRPLPR